MVLSVFNLINPTKARFMTLKQHILKDPSMIFKSSYCCNTMCFQSPENTDKQKLTGINALRIIENSTGATSILLV